MAGAVQLPSLGTLLLSQLLLALQHHMYPRPEFCKRRCMEADLAVDWPGPPVRATLMSFVAGHRIG
eukprot:1157495-Pelagomonas_calceolata.AAC.3